jgi:CHAT domain-containing protein
VRKSVETRASVHEDSRELHMRLRFRRSKFIYAGAQHVVCSLWPVSDTSTRTLMTAFYEALNSGASVEEALQASQNALPPDGDTAHPFFWAGYIAVSGPG